MKKYIHNSGCGWKRKTSKTLEAIKVCCITYSDNEELAYEKNITEKITNLEIK